MEKLERVTLLQLSQGAAGELFDDEFEKVLRNILDINTDPKAKRKISLEIELAPAESREVADITIKGRVKARQCETGWDDFLSRTRRWPHRSRRTRPEAAHAVGT